MQTQSSTWSSLRAGSALLGSGARPEPKRRLHQLAHHGALPLEHFRPRSIRSSSSGRSCVRAGAGEPSISRCDAQHAVRAGWPGAIARAGRLAGRRGAQRRCLVVRGCAALLLRAARTLLAPGGAAALSPSRVSARSGPRGRRRRARSARAACAPPSDVERNRQIELDSAPATQARAHLSASSECRRAQESASRSTCEGRAPPPRRAMSRSSCSE